MDGLLHERDYPVYRPGIELAITESVIRVHPVVVGRERSLIFGDRLFGTALRPQHLAFRGMRERAARRCG
jgi:hypothetical protein